jgi:tetratricopeptide (TPR) repeat protein
LLVSNVLWAEEPARLAADEVGDPPELVYSPSSHADLVYRILLGEIAGKRGEFDVALENYAIAAQATDDPRVAERAAGIALFLGEHAAALQIARRWYELSPDNSKAQQMLVLALLKSKALDEAVEQLEVLRVAGADDGQAGFGGVAALLSQVEDKDAVFDVMVKLRDRHPNSPFAHYYFALAALGKDDRQQALEGLDAALAADASLGQAHLLRARVLMDMHRIDDALSDLGQAVERLSEDYDLRLGYARLLVGSGRLDEAQNQFELLVEQKPQDPEILYALGLLSIEAEQLDQAEGYLMRVLDLGKRIMDVYYELGRVEELRGNDTKAREWYGRVVVGQDRYLNAQVRVGAILARLDDFDGLAQLMTSLRREHAEDAIGLYLAEAEILRDSGRYEASFELLGRALGEYPEDNNLLYARGLAAEKLDLLDILEQDLRAIIATDPENGHALNALGYTLADRTDRYQEALGYLTKAIALLPDDSAVLDSMGWIKYRLGDLDVSLEYLRRAYEQSPDPEIAAHLSEVLWSSGKHDEARELWRQANEENPENEFLLDVKGRLGL